MARYMLDTNICIYIRNRRPIQVLDRFRTTTPGAAVISVVTYGELRLRAEKGAQRERDLAIISALLSSIPVEPMAISAAEEYASIRADLERRGRPIGGNDLWIAAHARAAGLTLVTNNEREFRRVPGLTVENWATLDGE